MAHIQFLNQDKTQWRRHSCDRSAFLPWVTSSVMNFLNHALSDWGSRRQIIIFELYQSVYFARYVNLNTTYLDSKKAKSVCQIQGLNCNILAYFPNFYTNNPNEYNNLSPRTSTKLKRHETEEYCSDCGLKGLPYQTQSNYVWL